MSAGTRLVLSGFAAAAAAALATLSEGIASADDAPGSPPGVVGDALAGRVEYGEFVGTQPGQAGPAVVITPIPAPTQLLAAPLEQATPGQPAPPATVPEPVQDRGPFADPAPGPFAASAPDAPPPPAPGAEPALDPASEVVHASDDATGIAPSPSPPGPAPDPEPVRAEPDTAAETRPIVLVPTPENSTQIPVLTSAAVPAGALPQPASTDVTAEPGPPLVHGVVGDAAVDKSAIRYDPNPVAATTGTDITSGLLAAGVDPAVLDTFSAATRTIIGGESGGSVNAVNRWDSNAHGAVAADGAPGSSSRGPMQTIPGTFAAFHAPGTSLSIYDPRANIAAAWRYISAHYWVDLHTGRGLAAFMARGVGHGVGY